MKKHVLGVAALSVAGLFFACNDETTSVNQTAIPAVEKLKDLEKCTEENEGELFFVNDSAKVFVCAKSKWQSLNGTDGSAGENGESCEVAAIKNGYKILCGGDSVGVLLNGEDGKDGSGCTVKALSDKTGYKVLCNEDSVGVVLNGKKGDNGLNGNAGESCSLKDTTTETNIAGVKITCGDESSVIWNGAKGDNGTNGESCTAVSGTNSEGKSGYKIVCGTEEKGFITNGSDGPQGDPGASCYAQEACWPFKGNAGKCETTAGYIIICGDNVQGFMANDGFGACEVNIAEEGEEKVLQTQTYKIDEEYCSEINYAILSKSKYCPLKNNAGQITEDRRLDEGEFCFENKIYSAKVYGTCNGSLYNKSTHFCSSQNTIEKLCDGNTFNPATSFCRDNRVQLIIQACYDYQYETVTTFDAREYQCYFDNSENKLVLKETCNGDQYDPGTFFCSNYKLYLRCGEDKKNSVLYDAQTQICRLGVVNNICAGENASGNANGGYSITLESDVYEATVVYSNTQSAFECQVDDKKQYKYTYSYGGTTYEVFDVIRRLNDNINTFKGITWMTQPFDNGKMYTWTEALGKEADKCGVGEDCSVKYGSEPNARIYSDSAIVLGVCPPGWRLANRLDWVVLLTEEIPKDSIIKKKYLTKFPKNGYIDANATTPDSTEYSYFWVPEKGSNNNAGRAVKFKGSINDLELKTEYYTDTNGEEFEKQVLTNFVDLPRDAKANVLCVTQWEVNPSKP